MFIAHVKQDGGCDYTIACGETMWELEANQIDDAVTECKQRIEESHMHPESRLASVTIFETRVSSELDVDSVYKEIEDRQSQKKEKLDTLKERAEYERLKGIFG